MESILATFAQCACLARAERISLPASPVSELTFQWNALISLSERHQIHSSLSQVHNDLTVLDDALAHITSIQTRLLEKRNAMQAFSDRLKALVSPIRPTPPEIFAEIFSYLKGNYRDEIPAHARAQSLLPTHVCQQWRDIALSIPSLWNHIYINGGSLSETQSIRNSEVECISTWLARAKDCPLSINLRRSDWWCDDYDFERDDAWNAIFDIVVRRSHRWRHAILLSTHNTDFSRLSNRLPLLETLEIDCPACSEVDIVGNAFEVAPRLSSVTLSSGTIGKLPWPQLKVFITDGGLGIVQGLALLQQMPNIVTFSTEIFYELEPSRFIDTPLQMTKLESLSVIEIEPFTMGAYLMSLRLPSLKTIKLSGDNPPEGLSDEWPWVQAVISMIQRSSCVIKTLEITLAVWEGQSSLGDLLRVTPQLETLIIRWGTRYDLGEAVQLLKAPIGTCNTPCVVPKLQHLELLYRPPFEPQAFVDMVNSRWRVTSGGCVARLKSIKLSNILSAAIFDSSHLERLSEFAAEGLDIKINFGN
ncbi:hypothetical protein HWV62_18908 [Athelia sp. TMB]|nr:hypothetical protein HWV62_18908 [Athelia sp. TMB]